MRTASLWGRLLGVEQAIVDRVCLEEDDAGAVLVAAVRPHKSERKRCGVCRRRCGGYDSGEGRRRWRALDLGTMPTYLEAEAPRVTCPEHGVVVASVPWARHDSRFTTAFEDQTAWLTTHSSKSTVSNLMRVVWRTVGGIIARVAAEAENTHDRFSGLHEIGIDEISYRKGHKYITVVVDHRQGRLVWAQPGKDEKTLSQFFEALGPKRCAAIKLVSADGATWISNAVAKYCPNATLCLDPFHVVSWATDALDEVRRDVWNEARRSGDAELAATLKDARYALWKNPENLTSNQYVHLAHIAQLNEPLYRAYLLKEQLRRVFALRGEQGKRLLKQWLDWARRCRIRPFVDLARTITKRRHDIQATLDLGLSNALVESVNTKIRLLARQAFGFHYPEALIGLAMLALGGLCPSLPGRSE